MTAKIEHTITARAVPAKTAFRAIGVGLTTGWELISQGRIDAFRIGRKVLVTVESIDQFVAAAPRIAKATNPAPQKLAA